MALSPKARRRLEVAMAHRADAKEIADAIDAATPITVANVTDIADPSTANAEDVATKLNALLAALRTAGLMK